MSLLHLRSLVALHAGSDIHAANARIRGIMRRRTARWLDDALFACLEKTNARFFLECGARDARASRRFVHKTAAMAVALEANPDTWQRKTRPAEQQGVITLNCGVGPNDDDVLDFFTPADHGTASNASFMRKAGQRYKTHRIQTRSIDGLCDEYFSDSTGIALWIDVEGMALEVLGGARKMLDAGRCAALKVEVETRSHWVGQHLASEVDAFMQARGYVGVLCDFEYEDQFNVLYIPVTSVDLLRPVIEQQLFELSRQRVTATERLFKSRAYPWRKKPS